jgi:preprotein translocase subunit SecE
MKAVVEASRMEKGDDGKGEGGKPAWLTEAVTWAPQKLRQVKTFFAEVKSELKKVTWPSWPEVRATTVVVVATTVFFGFYLFGIDLLLSQVFRRILGQ